MELKSLKSVQIIAKICRVLSIIAVILSIVGLVGSAAGIVTMAALGDTVIKGKSISIIIAEKGELTVPEYYTTLACAAVSCAVGIFLACRAKRYFTREIEAGTPFTEPLSKELRTLGILYMAFGIGTQIVCAIGAAIVSAAYEGMKTPDVHFASFGLGLVFFIVSFICRYGADLREKNGL